MSIASSFNLVSDQARITLSSVTLIDLIFVSPETSATVLFCTTVPPLSNSDQKLEISLISLMKQQVLYLSRKI